MLRPAAGGRVNVTASQFAKLASGNIWIYANSKVTSINDGVPVTSTRTDTYLLGVATATGVTEISTTFINTPAPAGPFVSTSSLKLDTAGNLVSADIADVITTVLPANLTVGTFWTYGNSTVKVTGINTSHTNSAGTFNDVMTLSVTGSSSGTGTAGSWSDNWMGTVYLSMAVGNVIEDAMTTIYSLTFGGVTLNTTQTTTSILQPGYIAN